MFLQSNKVIIKIIVFSFTCLFSLTSKSIERDLFEETYIDFPTFSQEENFEDFNSEGSDLLTFDEDTLLKEFSNIDPGRELINSSKNKEKQYIPTNSRRNLVSTNDVITELAALGFPNIWTNGKKLNSKGKNLIKFIKNSYKHGLIKSDYSFKILKKGNASVDDLEIIASKSFVDITNDILLGRLYPKKADYDWHISQSSDYMSINSILNEAIESNDITRLLNEKLPEMPVYKHISNKLFLLKTKRKKWVDFPSSGSTLKFKRKSKDIKILRRRLFESGYLRRSKGKNVFDKNLVKAVKKFQKEHGLNITGVVNKNTRKALAVNKNSRITQLEQTLERLRWLPNSLPKKYIFVNTAASELRVIKNNKTLLRMRTVVGQKRESDENNFTETPSFSKEINHIIINPEWYVPQSIVKREFLREIQKSTDFLAKNNYQVYDYWGKKKIDASSIKWLSFDEETHFPYQIRQGVGENNALGRVKFMFPNKFNIYLHDTPSKSLFKHEKRFYSHGCVRLEKPFKLAEKITYLDNKEIKEILKSGKRTKVELDNKIKVFIAYINAWATSDGTVIFYGDNYGLDARMKNNFL